MNVAGTKTSYYETVLPDGSVATCKSYTVHEDAPLAQACKVARKGWVVVAVLPPDTRDEDIVGGVLIPAKRV